MTCFGAGSSFGSGFSAAGVPMIAGARQFDMLQWLDIDGAMQAYPAASTYASMMTASAFGNGAQITFTVEGVSLQLADVDPIADAALQAWIREYTETAFRYGIVVIEDGVDASGYDKQSGHLQLPTIIEHEFMQLLAFRVGSMKRGYAALRSACYAEVATKVLPLPRSISTMIDRWLSHTSTAAGADPLDSLVADVLRSAEADADAVASAHGGDATYGGEAAAVYGGDSELAPLERIDLEDRLPRIREMLVELRQQCEDGGYAPAEVAAALRNETVRIRTELTKLQKRMEPGLRKQKDELEQRLMNAYVSVVYHPRGYLLQSPLARCVPVIRQLLQYEAAIAVGLAEQARPHLVVEQAPGKAMQNSATIDSHANVATAAYSTVSSSASTRASLQRGMQSQGVMDAFARDRLIASQSDYDRLQRELAQRPMTSAEHVHARRTSEWMNAVNNAMPEGTKVTSLPTPSVTDVALRERDSLEKKLRMIIGWDMGEQVRAQHEAATVERMNNKRAAVAALQSTMKPALNDALLRVMRLSVVRSLMEAAAERLLARENVHRRLAGMPPVTLEDIFVASAQPRDPRGAFDVVEIYRLLVGRDGEDAPRRRKREEGDDGGAPTKRRRTGEDEAAVAEEDAPSVGEVADLFVDAVDGLPFSSGRMEDARNLNTFITLLRMLDTPGARLDVKVDFVQRTWASLAELEQLRQRQAITQADYTVLAAQAAGVPLANIAPPLLQELRARYDVMQLVAPLVAGWSAVRPPPTGAAGAPGDEPRAAPAVEADVVTGTEDDEAIAAE